MAKPKVSRIEKKLEGYFNMSFPEIVATYLENGMSRYQCAQKLTDLTGGDIEVKPSTLWNCVKKGIEEETISGFDFNGRKKETVKVEYKTVDIHYSCSCGHIETLITEVEDFESMLLRTKKCKKCKKFGTSSLSFEFDGIPSQKKIIKLDGFLQESFVDSDNNPIDNPYKKVHNESYAHQTQPGELIT